MEKLSLQEQLGYVEIPKVEEEKEAKLSPFDFVKDINQFKTNLIVDDWSENQYNPFIINRALSYGVDTIIAANEMNSRPHLPKAAQNLFLLNMIKPKKRFNEWLKTEEIEDIEVVKQYYGYSTRKATQVLSILSREQIEHLRKKLKKGGTDERND